MLDVEEQAVEVRLGNGTPGTPGSCGWGSTYSQEARYTAIKCALPHLDDKHVVEVGCGYGAGIRILKPMESYLGYELCADLVALARKRYPTLYIKHGEAAPIGADIVIASGVTCYRGELSVDAGKRRWYTLFKSMFANSKYLAVTFLTNTTVEGLLTYTSNEVTAEVETWSFVERMKIIDYYLPNDFLLVMERR